MSQQILIIGLGHFGMSLAKTLSEKGIEVLAVDKRRALVEEAAEFVTDAIVMDATDEEDLANLNPRNRDVAVCAIGDDSKESSIICTALLKQMGAPFIVSRAHDPMLKRILKTVGANEIINPEEEYGRKYANRLLYKDLIENTEIGKDLLLNEIHIPKNMIGKSLINLELPKRHGVLVAGIRHNGSSKVDWPDPNAVLSQEDRLIIVCRESAIPKLIKEYS